MLKLDIHARLRGEEVPERDEVPEDEPEHDVLAVERQQRLEERQRHRAQLRLAPDPQGQLQKKSKSMSKILKQFGQANKGQN